METPNRDCGALILGSGRILILHCVPVDSMLIVLVIILIAVVMDRCVYSNIKLCVIILFTMYDLLEDNLDVQREQMMSGESATYPGDVILIYAMKVLDISVRNTLHPGVLVHFASSLGLQPLKGEMEKDAKQQPSGSYMW